MKKTALVFSLIFGAILLSNAQCTVDTTQVASGKFFSPDTFPCAVRTVAYNQILQFKVPYSINVQDFVQIPVPYTVYIDSIQIDSITGFPAGIKDSTNPANGHFFPGKGGCAKLYGTTTAPKGNYPLTAHGFVTVHGTPQPLVGFDGDSTFSLDQLAQLGKSPFSFSVDVINVGDQCRPSVASGMEILNSFNAIMKIYPNPATGTLNLDINTVDRINGSINVFDALGRKISEEKIDLLGLMNKQINVSSFPVGIYTLQITDSKNSFKTKFVVE